MDVVIRGPKLEDAEGLARAARDLGEQAVLSEPAATAAVQPQLDVGRTRAYLSWLAVQERCRSRASAAVSSRPSKPGRARTAPS